MKKCLVLVIENSDTNLGAGLSYKNAEEKAKSEPLEEEVVRCLEGWNKCVNEDIDMFVVCPSKRLPKQSTVEKIRELGARYIEVLLPETEYFTCGYWNVPVTMAWFEEEFDYDLYIHIDLDMTMFRNPRPDMFSLNDGVDARVGILSQEEMKDVHIGDYEQHHETCFMVARKGFYSYWWNLVKRLTEEYDSEWERYAELEEYAIDIMWKTTHLIEPEQFYQIGTRYPVSDIPDSWLNNVIFIHAHPYEDNSNMWREWLKRYVEHEIKKNPL